jgi:polysaccharide deacetylase family protein (PEP-CTERM system associated)
MKNVLTVDLEDYYHATAFSAHSPGGGEDAHLSRVESNTDRVLEVLAGHNCSATFFTVGAVADKFPGLIQRIARAGHELACHSYAHRLVFTLTREQFLEDTRRAKCAIEDAAGVPVHGYRAPSFSIRRDTEWAFDVLTELGFTYDSSIFPIQHLNFELQNAPRSPFVITTATGSLLEFPMPTLQLLGMRAPLAGGAYLRLLPYGYTRWGINFLNASERLPVCVYIHPWELDPGQPRMKGSLSARMRHYFGLRGLTKKLQHLLSDFEFQPLRYYVSDLENQLAQSTNSSLPRLRPQELYSSESRFDRKNDEHSVQVGQL